MATSLLGRDAQEIWQAGVAAVQPQNLVTNHFSVEGRSLVIRETSIDLSRSQRLVVVGGGKAAADMATAFEAHVVPSLQAALPNLEIEGLLNSPTLSPEQTQQRDLLSKSRAPLLEVVEARPIGLNAPTELAVHSTQRILQLAASCTAEDVVLCLLSGGGSALLTAPPPGITLADKQSVARLLAAAGASIEQLNTVRRSISAIKGGGLARACKASRLVTAILSDVLGDSLETIASGPTVADANCCPADALQVLSDLGLASDPGLTNVIRYLESHSSRPTQPPSCSLEHVILGNNADAALAAQKMAIQLGYDCPDELVTSANSSEPGVEIVASRMNTTLRQLISDAPQKRCSISGGEPTVQLPDSPGRGGRNQQLALLLLNHLLTDPLNGAASNYAFLSGGTDGEDGPTDAAGAWFDQATVANGEAIIGLDKIQEHLANADAYPAFEQLGTLLRTGITGTNVCDLRILLTEPA